MNNFGITLTDHPNKITQDELRNLLTIHGVICFRGIELTDTDLYDTMSKLGPVQDFKQQQAPESAADKNNNTIINLHNGDFLGKSRMGWHADQTYLTAPYLPIRSLYCSEVTEPNVTEFADVKFLTDKVLERWPELKTEIAKYYIDSERRYSNIRGLFSYCEHVEKNLFRYDNRLDLLNGMDSYQFKEYCKGWLNSDQIPKFAVEWQPFDFVIFDNNQAPHRRSVMNGVCKLKRLTSYFWL
jgi:alpha-ketoglutarate-dependent taurine dioxygenase